MPWPDCDVCGQPALAVASSAMGAISFAYCRRCAVEHLEPYDALVGGLAFCGPPPLVRDHVRDDMLFVIDASLAFAKKTWDDLARDVKKLEEDFEAHMQLMADTEGDL